MLLRRLEIQGFKTFASRTVVEFDPGITAVIGPNGSGKTNIVDAIRWVLGEQSPSALRSRRSEDLVFSGGPRRAPAGFAEVALTIDNRDRSIPLAYDEVTIARRVTRAGEGEYFINRTRVRLRELQEAVGNLGGSYTIVNQGMVDAALNLRPDERRRLFEDAAAIGVFEARRVETERRLRETDANMQRCGDLLAESEPRLRSLRRQATQARNARELHMELLEALRSDYAQRLALAQAAERATTAQEQDAAAALAVHQAALEQAGAQLAAARATLATHRDVLRGLHAESSALHQQSERAQRELAVIQERRVALERRATEQARMLAELELHREAAVQDRATHDQHLAVARAHAAEREQHLAELEREQAAHVAAHRTFAATVDAARRTDLEAAAAAAEYARRLSQLDARRQRVILEQARDAAVLAAAEAHHERLLADAHEAEQRAQTHQLALDQATRQRSSAEADREAARQQRASLADAEAAARRTLADAEARLESLTRLQRSLGGVHAGVRAALQWAEREQRPGFAMVSSIIHSPPALETAIEIALGARLQHIVVARWDDAEAAIEALRRSGAGRATFLPLDTLRHGDERRPDVRDAGIVGVAADLVTCDDAYRIVVQSLLGRTLVVEGLADARRALERLRRSGFAAWQLVTLVGDLISGGGAVTGGTAVRESGVLRRERELRELPAAVDQARAALAQAGAARTAADGAAERTDGAVRDAEQALATARRAAAQLAQLLVQAQSAAAQAERDAALARGRATQRAGDLADLDEQQAAVSRELALARDRAATTAAALLALRDEEQHHATADVARRTQLDAARRAVALAAGEIRAEAALLTRLEQTLASAEEQRRAAADRATALTAEQRHLQHEQSHLDAAVARLRAALEDVRRRIVEPTAAVALAEQQIAEGEHAIEQLHAARLAAESALNRAALERQRAADQLALLAERAAADEIDLAALPAPDAVAAADRTEQIHQLRLRLQRLGAVNPLALDEYEAEAARHAFLTGQLDDLHQAATALRTLIDELETSMVTRFDSAFHAIATEFELSFQRLFGGGQARLVLVDADGEPLRAGQLPRLSQIGIDIAARPPGKRQQTLALLSGGERALTAVALLFAMLHVNPTPFCVLDEVDAALDESNVGRFRHALGALIQQTQFVIVTHNRGTIEAADTIYGVSMGDDGASRMLSLRIQDVPTDA